MSAEMRHATTDELLALRDGEGTQWTREHSAACEACARELFRLEQLRARLRALPVFDAPRDRWPVVAEAFRRERRSRRARAATGMIAAAALTALTFVALRPAGSHQAEDQLTLDRAMVRSQALEQTLRSLSPEQRALTGDAASVVAELQEKLSRIDNELGEPRVWRGTSGRAAELWQQRAGVLDALVDVHTTRAAMAGL